MLAVYGKKTRNDKNFSSKLARLLGVPRLAPDGVFKRVGYNMINWGCSEYPERHQGIWAYNTAGTIEQISHKIRMFLSLDAADVPHLAWTTSQETAQGWCENGHKVYARHKLTGHSGQGIEVIAPGGDVPAAPLYTRGITEAFAEYRVHVVGGRIVCVQQKKKMGKESLAKREWEAVPEPLRSEVRTYRNGWVFCVKDITPLSAISNEVVLNAMDACGAKMGCVDLMVMNDTGLPVVIELNSAPALRSNTVCESYVKAIKEDFPNG